MNVKRRKSHRLSQPTMYRRKGRNGKLLQGYYVRFSLPNGTRPEKFLGLTKKEAEQKYKEYFVQVCGMKKCSYDYKITIRQAMDYLLNVKQSEKKGERTIEKYSGDLRTFEEFLDDSIYSIEYIHEVTPELIIDYMNWLDEDYMASTINGKRMVLGQMFGLLMKHDKYDQNPVAKTSPLKEDETDVEIFSKEQVHEFLMVAKAITKPNGINWYGIFTFLFETGMRRNEIRFLRMADILFQQNQIMIANKVMKDGQKFSVKNRENRMVPFTPALRKVIDSISCNQYLVFPNTEGNVLHRNKIYEKFQKICDLAGLPRKKQHVTRHTWCVHSLMNGIPESLVQQVGGWKDADVMKKRYAKFTNNMIVDSYSKSNIYGEEERPCRTNATPPPNKKRKPLDDNDFRNVWCRERESNPQGVAPAGF